MSEHIFKAQLQEPHIIYYSTAYDLISWDVTVSEDASSCHASLQMESMRFHYKGLLLLQPMTVSMDTASWENTSKEDLKYLLSSLRILVTLRQKETCCPGAVENTVQ